MQYLFLAAVIAYWSYRYVNRKKNKKRKAEALKRIDTRIKLAEKHIYYSSLLFDLFIETKDLSYLDYSYEELDKAQILIDLNSKDQQRL